MGALMCRLLDDEMWARGGAGGKGSYNISLRDAAKQSLEENAQGDSLPSNLLSSLLEGGGNGNSKGSAMGWYMCG